jgi:hypothetical protein
MSPRSASTTASAILRGASGSARSTSRAIPRWRRCIASVRANSSARPRASPSATAWPGARTAARCTGQTPRLTRSTHSTSTPPPATSAAGASSPPSQPNKLMPRSALYGGRPDGAAVDAEGAYWVAMFEGQRLLKLSPEGKLLREVPLPVRCATMPCFGGPDLKTIYITTARENRPNIELMEQPFAGCVLALDVDVPGLPVNFAHCPELIAMLQAVRARTPAVERLRQPRRMGRGGDRRRRHRPGRGARRGQRAACRWSCWKAVDFAKGTSSRAAPSWCTAACATWRRATSRWCARPCTSAPRCCATRRTWPSRCPS